jgi:hypothetical protein
MFLFTGCFIFSSSQPFGFAWLKEAYETDISAVSQDFEPKL